jgi:aldehyde dehydrogenase (NAD+)
MDRLNSLYHSQRSYFRSGKTLPVDARLQKLRKLKSVLIQYEQGIYEALNKDLNKPVLEAFLGEFLGMMHELDTAIAHLKKWSRKKRTKSSLLVFPSKAYVVPEPYGHVLIISPWNYPIDLCISPLIGAIAAGNTAMVKPSRSTPYTSQVIKELLADVFEEEYVGVLTGETDTKALMQLRFDYIFFTGSVSVGKEVMKAAASHLTPVTLELGGKCPVIVCESSNIKKAAKSIAWGKYYNAGQSCVAPDYVFVHKNYMDDFRQYFKLYTDAFLQNKSSDYTRVINENHFERLLGYLTQGEVIYGGEYAKESLQLFPTLVLPQSTEAPLMQDEIFGPILPVIIYNDREEIVRFINSREKALVAYIFSANQEEINYYIKQTSSGNICINDTMLSYVNKNLPFGGVGQSGMGKYHGKASFDTFSHYKSVHHKLNPDLPFRYPPYKKQYKMLWPFKNILNKNI